jgi:urease beta subunit
MLIGIVIENGYPETNFINMKCLKNYSGILIMFTVVILLYSCSGSKEASGMKKIINGNWTLKTIAIEGNNSIINVKVFNEADNNCFIGSQWNFISNNSTGTYKIPAGAGNTCIATSRKIRWSIYEPKGEEKKFQFKRLDDKNNPMDNDDGYRLNVSALTDSSMQLKSDINYEGKPVAVIYNFIKN